MDRSCGEHFEGCTAYGVSAKDSGGLCTIPEYLSTIVRINQRTASIDPGDGTTWRMGFALLRHVVDI